MMTGLYLTDFHVCAAFKIDQNHVKYILSYDMNKCREESQGAFWLLVLGVSDLSPKGQEVLQWLAVTYQVDTSTKAKLPQHSDLGENVAAADGDS